MTQVIRNPIYRSKGQGH